MPILVAVLFGVFMLAGCASVTQHGDAAGTPPAKSMQPTSSAQSTRPAMPAGMTLAEARARIPTRSLPDFWVGDLDKVQQVLGRASHGQLRTVATSPGGRPIQVITYGPVEPLPGRANFNSAVGAGEPEAYADRAHRAKPVVYFVGPVHGHEVEGLTGVCNLISIMETGADLAGKPRPHLAEMAGRCRVVILVNGNPDGLARFEPRCLVGMEQKDIRFWGQGTWSNGEFCGWPQCKRLHPMAGPKVGFLGCYFDDAGVNAMHDEVFAPMGPATKAIIDIARAEAPDLTILLHSSQCLPFMMRTVCLPMKVQQTVHDLACRFKADLDQAHLPADSTKDTLPRPGDDTPITLTSAIYHTSGSPAVIFECPHGTQGPCPATWEQILEIQMCLYDAAFTQVLEKRAGAPAAK